MAKEILAERIAPPRQEARYEEQRHLKKRKQEEKRKGLGDFLEDFKERQRDYEAGSRQEECMGELLADGAPKTYERPKEERKRRELLAGSDSQEVTAEEVERLIAEAQKGAFEEEGRGKRSSQQFHRTVAERLANCFTQYPDGCTISELGPFLDDVLVELTEDESTHCKLKSMAGRKSLFPLPAPERHSEEGPKRAFLQALVRGLNSMHGISQFSKGNQTSLRALKRLEGIVGKSAILDEKLPQLDFPTLFSSRGVDYHGEEVHVAKRIRWESIAPSLPEQVGTLDVREFCEGGVLHFIDHIHDYLLPIEDQVIGKTPSVMVEPGEWERVATGLVERGLCDVVPVSSLHHVRGKALLNGMFCVGKQEFFEGSHGRTEVCRLIMNLKPANLISRPLEGDTGTLPAITQMGSYHLADDELLCTSSEDLRCFFYLFRVPQAWQRFLGFGRDAPEELIPEKSKGERHVLAAKVLPMGYLNSVGIAQHIHRLITRRCLSQMPLAIGGHQEIRRDRVFSSHDTQFRVYLDNFDLLQKHDREAAAMIEGKPSDLIMKLREAYDQAGLPIHPKKSTQQALGAEVQGAWIDGDKGTVAAKPSKIGKYVRLGLELLIQGRASQRELQIVGGGFVYISMFRRPMLGTLNQIWRSIVSLEDKPSSVRVVLRKEVMSEIARFIALVPLAFISLRNPFDSLVTASDASTTGGGFCVSQGLSPYGLAASSSWVRGDIPEEHDFCQILAIGLFDGIAALRVALDTLGAPIAGYVSVEISSAAQRVCEANFPDTILVQSVEDVDEDMVVGWSLRFSGVGLVLLGGGPPCQGVSGLNSDRKGALRDSRSSLFFHVPRIENLCKQAFKWAQVHRLAENVASMDRADCQTMNDSYDGQPWFIDSAGVSLAHRPRLYWFTWEIMEEEDVEIYLGSDGKLPIEGEVKLHAQVCEQDFLEPGCARVEQKPFPTFTTSRPSPFPLRRPAGLRDCEPHELQRWKDDQHRFPPYQYKNCHCVLQRDGTLRPPSVLEREVILGFPAQYTKQCLVKGMHDTPKHTDQRLTLLGNTWSIPVISWLLGQLLMWLGLIPKIQLKDIVRALTPGMSSHLQNLLLRPPMRMSTKTFEPSALLIRKMSGLTSIKGEDLLLQSKTEVPVRFHRLRASVPSKLWRWRAISGWQWTGDKEHINVLELRSVLTTLRWRVEQLGQMDIRSLHLVDSLVVLHGLTRGRSSSRKMRRTLMRIGSILLACGLAPLWSYVDTKQNPADKPSRWGVKKRWVKLKRK